MRFRRLFALTTATLSCGGAAHQSSELDAPCTAAPARLFAGQRGPCVAQTCAAALPGGVRDFASNGRRSCAIDGSSKLWCWNLTVNDAWVEVPTPIDIGANVRAVAVGGSGSRERSCLITEAGGAMCWEKVRPEAIGPGNANFIAIGVGRGFDCALASDGAVTCWGYGGPLRPYPSSEAQSAALSGCLFEHAEACGDEACADAHAAAEDGCWRSILGANPSDAVPPRRIAGMEGIAQLAVGSSFVCGRTADGAVFCAGSNDAGQLGDGRALRWLGGTNHGVPVRLPAPATDVAATDLGACAATPRGIFCWGQGGWRRGGDRAADLASPTVVRALPAGAQVATPGSTVCTVCGQVPRCWP